MGVFSAEGLVGVDAVQVAIAGNRNRPPPPLGLPAGEDVTGAVEFARLEQLRDPSRHVAAPGFQPAEVREHEPEVRGVRRLRIHELEVREDGQVLAFETYGYASAPLVSRERQRSLLTLPIGDALVNCAKPTGSSTNYSRSCDNPPRSEGTEPRI
ncbi:hypothetical protein [Leucobacter celer]|uniref:hypothetical protein n=1 Tax=Leucobacter celer TaxID=668625 RepID=UPI000AA54546|nr:hypothetical protein [Leucobacter celer]